MSEPRKASCPVRHCTVIMVEYNHEFRCPVHGNFELNLYTNEIQPVCTCDECIRNGNQTAQARMRA